MNLYDFQKRAVKKAMEAIAQRTSLLVVSAVGSGKTLIMVDLARRYAAKGWEVVLVTPRKELVDQALAKLKVAARHLEVTTLYAGSVGKGGDTGITFGTIVSVTRRHPGSQSKDVLVLMDEAHHTPARSWKALRKLFPNAAMIGFTATPTRLDGKPLREHFSELYEAATPLETADIGLTRIPRICVSRDQDLWSHAHAFFQRRRGEISEKAANHQLLKKGLVGDIVQEWLDRAKGKKTLVFAASREHAHALVAQFARKKIRVGYVDGQLSAGVRNQRILDFRSGKFAVLVSVELLIEGFDLPEIDCGILARPTNSLVYHMQMCGRIARNYPGAGEALILDPVGNTLKVNLGLPEVPREWSLDGAPKTARDAQVAVCTVCGRCCSARAAVCDDCGTSMKDEAADEPKERSRVPANIEGSLAELNINPQKRAALWARLTKEIMDVDECTKQEAEARAEAILLRALGRRGMVADEVHARGARVHLSRSRKGVSDQPGGAAAPSRARSSVSGRSGVRPG